VCVCVCVADVTRTVRTRTMTLSAPSHHPSYVGLQLHDAVCLSPLLYGFSGFSLSLYIYRSIYIKYIYTILFIIYIQYYIYTILFTYIYNIIYIPYYLYIYNIIYIYNVLYIYILYIYNIIYIVYIKYKYTYYIIYYFIYINKCGTSSFPLTGGGGRDVFPDVFICGGVYKQIGRGIKDINSHPSVMAVANQEVGP